MNNAFTFAWKKVIYRKILVNCVVVAHMNCFVSFIVYILCLIFSLFIFVLVIVVIVAAAECLNLRSFEILLILLLF